MQVQRDWLHDEPATPSPQQSFDIKGWPLMVQRWLREPISQQPYHNLDSVPKLVTPKGTATSHKGSPSSVGATGSGRQCHEQAGQGGTSSNVADPIKGSCVETEMDEEGAPGAREGVFGG